VPPKYTPGWAVGYWFVPILNLARPYDVILELWRSLARRATVGTARPMIVGLWWVSLLFYSLVGRVAAAITAPPQRIGGSPFGAWASVFADAVGVVAALLAIGVVRRITKLAA
jgi:hypothetical protein